MKMKLTPFILVFLLLPLSGSVRAAAPLPRYVIGAQVSFYQPDRQQTLRYEDPAKISSLLTCLRLATPYGRVNAAEANPNAHHYRITLQYSDQTQQVYHLQDYRYFSRDGKTWQKVLPEKAHYLYLLLQLLPPDG